VVEVEPAAAEARYQERQPRTLLGAQYSLPFTTAVALVRDLSNPYAFDDHALADPLIHELAQRVEVRGTTSEPRVVVELEAQQLELAAVDFPGSTSQPLDFQAAADKLRRYAGTVVGEARTARLIELVDQLEQLDDVRPLAAAIAA
jgi:2-methylcitrate dehydratase PrpD